MDFPIMSCVLPAYNEERNIGIMIREARQYFQEIIVVDDGSTDGTFWVSGFAGADRGIRHTRNLGYGAAVWDGLKAANGRYIFFTDADCQFDLSEVGALTPHLVIADMVIGCRTPRRDPWMRRFNAWGWNTLAGWMFDLPYRDIDCAFKIMRREVVERLDIKSKGATFSVELLWKAQKAGFSITEVPILNHKPRRYGRQTGASLKVIAKAFWELIKLRLS